MNRAQLDELHNLKSQETRLRTAIRRSEKRHGSAEKRAAMIEQREDLLERMKPLRDQLYSEIRNRLTAEYVSLFYGGCSSYEVANLFGYRSGETIAAKIREAERQVAGP